MTSLFGKMDGFVPSNAAYNLMGSPQLGTFGWKKKYWDNGRQLSPEGKVENQAHHFAAFFLLGLKEGVPYDQSVANWKAFILDGVVKNPQDLLLSKIAYSIAYFLSIKKLSWKDCPVNIYKILTDKDLPPWN